MKSLIAVIFILTLINSCQIDTTKEIDYIYNYYHFYRLHKDNSRIDRVSFSKVLFNNLNDSLTILTISEDSVYFPIFDTTEISDRKYQIQIKIIEENLTSSSIKIGDSDFYGNYVLTLLKKHTIKGKEYRIFRFDHDFDGDDGRDAIFYTKEFGIIMQFGYDKGGLDRLSEIKNSENKDYLVLTEKMLDDTVFLFTPMEMLYEHLGLTRYKLNAARCKF